MQSITDPPDILLELIHGGRIEAVLARPFVPDDNEIIVVPRNGSGEKIFPLAQVCLVTLSEPPPRLSSESDRLEEIETVNGQFLQVRIAEAQDYDTGFFGLQQHSDLTWKCIFFTFVGIRFRRLVPQALGVSPVAGRVAPLIDPIPPSSSPVADKQSEEDMPGAEPPLAVTNSLEQSVQRLLGDKQVRYRARIGEILMAAGLITVEQFEDALAYQKKHHGVQQIGAILIERGVVTERQVLAALCSKFQYELIDLDSIEPDPKALQAFTVDIIKQFQVFPIKDNGDHLVVAISNPLDHSLISVALQFHTNRRVEIVIATPTQIRDAISKFYLKAMEEELVQESLDGMFDEELAIEEPEKDDPNEPRITETDSKIIRMVNKILLDGYSRKASDIHVEPGQDKEPIQIRYRIDGICQNSFTVPKSYHRALISRLKIIGNLDITERRKPQSGKIITKVQNRKIEYRLEITPTVGKQEDAVIRVLSSAKPLPLEQMDFSPINMQRLKKILNRPYGIILCAGPTGSGKTTTLHSALKLLNTPERKIWTAEDPVEITQTGLRQVQVHAKIGLTFAEAMRSFLRGDPDVIMIGEIRDRETAKITVEASLTGHLVLSTLHTNSAPETVIRLIDLGVESYNFADALLGVLAQRLVRRLCESCKEKIHTDRLLYEEIIDGYGPAFLEEDKLPAYGEQFFVYRPKGCKDCGGSGYRSRVAIHELLVGSSRVKRAIKNQESVDAIREIAIAEGMRTLRMDGASKVLHGITDFEQVKGASVDESRDFL